jgi:putative sigma-54 modulation protein
MDVTVRGKHFDVPEGAAERAKSKLGRLDHFLPLLKTSTVEVDLAREKSKDPGGRFIVHASVRANGVHFRAEETAAKLEAAIDQAAHVLAEQARRHKQRLYGKSRHGSVRGREPALELENSGLEESTPGPLDKIATVEHVPIKPMLVEEAVEQMELLRTEFFVFLEGDSQRFAMLYRRSDGALSLVVPELS